VGLRADMDWCGKSRSPHRDRSPDRPAHSESYRLRSYPGSIIIIIIIIIVVVIIFFSNSRAKKNPNIAL